MRHSQDQNRRAFHGVDQRIAKFSEQREGGRTEGLDDISNSTYTGDGREKPVYILKGEIKSPPFSDTARYEVGRLLGILQKGRVLSMPLSRPMPVVGPRWHELRVRDVGANWRLIYRVDADAIVVAAIFDKKTRKTPQDVIELSKKRLRGYDHDGSREEKTA